MQSHAALNMDVKYTEPSSALTRISLTPLSPEGALAVSQELWLRGSHVCLSQLPLLDIQPCSMCEFVGQDSISPLSAGIESFLPGPGLRSWIHENTGPFQELRCWDQELPAWGWFEVLDSCKHRAPPAAEVCPCQGLCPHITEI